MKKTIQRSVQVVALALFALLFIQGKMQVWMIVFLASVVLALFFGRFYCGWLCPINTLIRPITWVKKKLRIKRKEMPAWIKSDVLRIVMAVLFLVAMGFVFVTGKQLPVLPFLIGAGVILSIFFDEALWHRHLCPYGTILSITGRFARKSVKIDPEACNNCTLCARVCPANAVIRDEKHEIVTRECLVCHECERVCNQAAINYQ